MPSTSWSYRATLRAGAALVPLAGLLNPKLRQGHDARLASGARLSAWAKAHRSPERPLAWFHAASVGEGLQAESVLLELRRLAPACQLVYTHFSPSAEALASRLAVDVADYLPYDRRNEVDQVLSALRPDLLVFAKLDLWPELATRAAQRECAVALVAATVSPGSGRLRWPARELLGAGYAAVTRAGAVAQDDADRLRRLGVPASAIEVLGDPRYDSVLSRVAAVGRDDPLLELGREGPTLVAGSTWGADERVLLAAFAALRRHRPDARLILVPHEPTDPHLRALQRRAARLGLGRPARLSRDSGGAPLLVVDRVGVLAALYGAGTMAYVGGGFGRAGLHSVLEPAAWGVPVIFGPRWRDSRDAAILLEHGGGAALRAVGRRTATAELLTRWNGWLADEASREAMGRRARAVVEGERGAAARSAAMLASLISSRRLRR